MFIALLRTLLNLPISVRSIPDLEVVIAPASAAQTAWPSAASGRTSTACVDPIADKLPVLQACIPYDSEVLLLSAEAPTHSSSVTFIWL